MSSWITKEHVRNICKLYKTILRLHRGLPVETKVIGDAYVKEEFKKHKNVSPQEAKIFIHAWTDYAVLLLKQLGVKGIARQTFGKDLSVEDLTSFKDDQLVQLYELLQASKDLGEATENDKPA